MLLSQAVQPYLTFCEVEKFNSKQTLGKYRDCFKSWLVPYLGDLALEKLDRLVLMDLRKRMTDKQLSIARQYSVLIALKTFLRFCVEVLKVQTLDPREVKLPNRGRPNVQMLTTSEINQLLASIDIHTYSGMRLRALIELLLATGMRISEALSLNRDIFDANASEIEVIGKGKKVRTIFFNERCKFWIGQYLNKRFDNNPALFVTTGYEPNRLAREDISRFFVNLRDRAGIKKKVTPHILRHTYCTNLRDNGADISLIKELAGHQDIATTAKYYIGVDKERLRKTVNKYLDYGLSNEGSQQQTYAQSA